MPNKEIKILAMNVSSMYFLYGLNKNKKREKKPFLSEPFSKFDVGCSKKAMPDHFLLNSTNKSEVSPLAGSL